MRGQQSCRPSLKTDQHLLPAGVELIQLQSVFDVEMPSRQRGALAMARKRGVSGLLHTGGGELLPLRMHVFKGNLLYLCGWPLTMPAPWLNYPGKYKRPAAGLKPV